MLRNPQISAKALFPFCRSMSRMLGAGVDVRKALKTSSANTRDPRLTESVAEVLQLIAKGDDLTDSFRAQERRYPPLFLDLLRVGEQTGSVPEIFESLADYYEAHVNRMREFRSQIAWPVIQLTAAVLIIGFLIYILGILGESQAGETQDILGLGLVGARGATIWFTTAFCLTFFGWVGYLLATRNLAGQMALHPFLMKIPGVGYCMKAFAIARFSWCFALTQKAGMPLRPSIESSLKATSNGAFVAAIPHVWRDLAEGETLTTALKATTLFPTEYLHMVDTAEQTGTVPEMLDRLSRTFDEDAHRAMTWLTGLIAKLIWGLVACFIGFIVISFFMRYVEMLNSFMCISTH
ncbi:MAG: type II secretion system F family protein [Planctomycetaceae bacterium]